MPVLYGLAHTLEGKENLVRTEQHSGAVQPARAGIRGCHETEKDEVKEEDKDVKYY